MVNVLQENRTESTQLYSHTALGLNLPSLDSGGRRKENTLSTVEKRDSSKRLRLAFCLLFPLLEKWNVHQHKKMLKTKVEWSLDL